MNKLVLIAVLLGSTATFGKGRLRPGNWHITVTHEMQGAPFTPPPTTLDQCITPPQAADPKQLIKSHSPDCDSGDVKIDGNKVTFSVVCHHRGGTQTGSGEMIYGGDFYSGTMTLEMDDPRRGHMKMIEHLAGQRTGDCPATP